MYILKYITIYICIYIHVYTHIRTHTHIYIYRYIAIASRHAPCTGAKIISPYSLSFSLSLFLSLSISLFLLHPLPPPSLCLPRTRYQNVSGFEPVFDLTIIHRCRDMYINMFAKTIKQVRS